MKLIRKIEQKYRNWRFEHASPAERGGGYSTITLCLAIIKWEQAVNSTHHLRHWVANRI